MHNSPPAEGQDRVVATIAKARGEEIRIGFSPFRGRTYFTARVWYRDSDGTMRPTPRGVNISVDQLPDIAKAFAQALEVAEAEGLLRQGDGRG